MFHIQRTAVIVVVAALAAGLAEAGLSNADVSEGFIRRTIIALDDMSQAEQEQMLPWLVNAISNQSDDHLKSRLNEALEKRLARLPVVSQQDQPAPDEEIGLAGQERESFEALLKREQQAPPSEEEIRAQIDAMAAVFDPKEPGVALNQAVEIGGVIDRIPDPDLRATLMMLLGDRLAALQGQY